MGSDNQKEDLYFWMAKQQDNKKKDYFAKEEILRPTPVNKLPGHTQTRQGIMQDSIKLLDAHLIFEPLLTCLGVMPQQMVNKFQNAGNYTKYNNFYANFYNQNKSFFFKTFHLWRTLAQIYLLLAPLTRYVLILWFRKLAIKIKINPQNCPIKSRMVGHLL